MSSFYSNADSSLNQIRPTGTGLAGIGMADYVVSSTVTVEKYKRVTEIVLDIGFATVNGGHGTEYIIGNYANQEANLGQMTPAINGYITHVEMICTEVPSLLADIDLWMADGLRGGSSSKVDASGTNVQLINSNGNWTLGRIDDNTWTHGTGQDLAVDNYYIYLTVGADLAGGPYNAGKFVIRLTGYIAPS